MTDQPPVVDVAAVSEPSPARAALEAVQEIHAIAKDEQPPFPMRPESRRRIVTLAREAAAHLAQVVEQENQP